MPDAPSASIGLPEIEPDIEPDTGPPADPGSLTEPAEPPLRILTEPDITVVDEPTRSFPWV